MAGGCHQPASTLFADHLKENAFQKINTAMLFEAAMLKTVPLYSKKGQPHLMVSANRGDPSWAISLMYFKMGCAKAADLPI